VHLPRALSRGVGVLATLAACTSGAPERPNVVLITIESLRTDHVGALGGRSRSRPEVPVTPNLDAFAQDAVVYTDAHAVTSWTLASHASLFTGLYPSAHQTIRAREKLGDSYVTLAEVLAGAGYLTAGVVSGPYLRRAHNLHQGFALYDDASASADTRTAHGDVTNPLVERALERFLDEQRDPERPFFLFVYLWDPHYDFLPPAPYDRMFVTPDCEPFDVTKFPEADEIDAAMAPSRLAYLWSQYAGEVRATDELLGRFFARLEAAGLWDDTAVIVTADHGEEFLDHGFKGHKNNVYAETVHVPLLVKYPGGATGRRDDRLVSHVDVLPTILQLAGATAPKPVHGRSLLAPAPDDTPAVYQELLALDYVLGPDGQPRIDRTRWGAIRSGGHKLVWREDGAGDVRYVELFDVGQDPAERHNVASEQEERARALNRRYDAWAASARRDGAAYTAGGSADLSAEEVRLLRALGYVY
jgi:arylsulfatase A-like enzyme